MTSSPTRQGLLQGADRTAQATPPNKPRRWLLIQAYIWRWLASFGFFVHRIPKPSPPHPNFLRYHTVGNDKLKLAFYTPRNYHREVRDGRKYPIVLNFHGGGFTVGSPTDDARWADMIVRRLGFVVVSAQYRLAPEHAFPTAVDDGVEALLWLASHADELGIDPARMALTGFSSGGKLSFTVPLRLQQSLGPRQSSPNFEVPKIKTIVSWYPSLDYRLSRVQRRATCPRPEKTLSPILTNLFDKSYLPNRDDKVSIYVSLAVADDEVLKTALPEDIAIYLCEWDMLQQEGADFAQRLSNMGKNVHCVTIKDRRHGFDKTPSPFGVDPKITQFYEAACDFLGASL